MKFRSLKYCWWLLIGLMIVFAGMTMATPTEHELDHLELTSQHIAILRKMQSEWVQAESGAPFLFFLPYDESLSSKVFEEKTVQKIRKLLGASTLSSSDAVKIYREAMQAFPIFVQFGELKPGTYTFESPHSVNKLKEQPYIEQGLAKAEGTSVTFKITQEHLDLLKAANIRFFDDGGIEAGSGVDPKRPYGDMTDFYIDMGEILHIAPEGLVRKDYPEMREFTDKQIKALDILHYGTQPALQVFLQKATIEPGTFVRSPNNYGEWKRKK